MVQFRMATTAQGVVRQGIPIPRWMIFTWPIAPSGVMHIVNVARSR
jgi:hypothetical protein